MARRILRQAKPSIEELPDPRLGYAANVALGEQWAKIGSSAAWKNLEDNLRQLDQRLVQDVFERKLTVEETEMARMVIQTMLGFPAMAAELAHQSRQMLEMTEGEQWESAQDFEELL